MIIKINPFPLLNSLFLFIIANNCKNIVTAININILILKSDAYIKGFITAPKPINKQRFRIFDPDMFPNNKSVSPLLADIIPVIVSGNAVPIAIIVIPINFSDIPTLPAIPTAY